MWFNILLVVVLIICTITDLKSRKIYNKIVFPTLLLSFLSHFFMGGWEKLFSSLIGFIIGLGLLLIPYLLGGMGAGDVKLLALIGALKGSSFVLYTSIYMAIFGGIMAIIVLLFRKNLWTYLKSLFYMLLGLKHGLKFSLPVQNGGLSATYPYGLAIACGAFFSLFMEGRIILW